MEKKFLMNKILIALSALYALSIVFGYTLFESPQDFKFYYYSLEDFNFIIEELDFK